MKFKNVKIMKLFVFCGIMLVSLSGFLCAAGEMDQRIESSVKNSYVFRVYLKEDPINVKSKNGVVTLSGTVSSRSHIGLAEETAVNMAGVMRVVNKLALNGERNTENSAMWIATKLKMALMFHKNVNASKTQVTVKDGVVTLEGEVNSSAQKELTGEYAKDIDGVKSVNNELKIIEPMEKNKETLEEKIDDASITAEVKMVLLYHRSTSALKTKVKTQDGVVNLSGTAHNAAEKDLVSKLVRDIKGVKDVNNHMTITLSHQG